jgi:[ribosomal protein S18]-alanine N-acetyltransferase
MARMMVSGTANLNSPQSTPSLQVAPAAIADLGAIADLDQRCFGGLWSPDAYQREIESPNSDLLLLNGGDAQAPLLGLGCLWAILEEAHITILAVHPQYRRLGYGRRLLTALLTAAHQRGLEWATLEVRPSNQAAVRLYEQFGFATVGRRRRYYQDNGEDALILWHKGLQTPEFKVVLEQWRSHKGVSD